MEQPSDDCTVYFNEGFTMNCGKGFAFSIKIMACEPEDEVDCENGEEIVAEYEDPSGPE